MVKKVLALALGLVLAFGAMAQMGPSNTTVAQSDIQFWTGTGSNRAVVAITWNDTTAGNIGIAWGVQWNGTTLTVGDIMDTIAAYDSRLAISWDSSHTYINNLGYTDSQAGLNLSGMVDVDMGIAWWWYNWKDASDNDKLSSGITGDTIANGDFVDWIPMDPDTYVSYAADTMIMATDPNAPQVAEATIDFSEILYWVGEGSNQAVMAVNWADTALAWGYRWNGSATVADMMDDIAAADPRFSYTASGYLDDILFNDGTVNLAGTPGNYWGSTNNGMMDAGLTQALANGDFEKWGDPAGGVVVDSMEYAGVWYYTYAYPMTIHPVSVPTTPQLEEATIAASEILYWVGEGSNQAVMAVNWADTALAWGYRFSTDSVSVQQVLDAIQTDDPRFSYALDSYGYLDDIFFVLGDGDTLHKAQYSWWESKRNGYSDMGLGQMLGNGDFEKWADPAAGIVVDSFYYADYDMWYYTYVYTMTINPVSVPVGIANVDDGMSVTVYPNPATSVVCVNLDAAQVATVELFDMCGRRVAATKAAAEVRIPVDALPNGVYMLRIGEYSAKVVIRH